MKKIAILGITGSIGDSALKIIRNHSERFQIVFASAHNNYQDLVSFAEEFSIPNIHLTNDKLAQNITDLPKNCQLTSGKSNLQEILREIDFDIMLNAIAGSAGLESSITCIKMNKDLALANKESLVMAGHLIKPMLAKSKTKLLPVDSEHSAIFQALGNRPTSEIKKLHITASGGPFRALPLSEFQNITLEKSLQHPTWNMGTKITIDSATMMNKALEVIEAHWLFDVDFSQIEAVIHPQSVIHSMVEFVDGSIIAQMSEPTMELPILFAFSFPQHIPSANVQTNLFEIGNLTFQKVDFARYPLFELALKIGETGGIMPTLMNAANEAAIDLFAQKKIHFTDIHKIVRNFISQAENIQNPDLHTIIDFNQKTYLQVIQNYKSLL